MTLTTSSKRHPRLVEHRAHVLEHLPHLRGDVVSADERPLAVDADQSRDEEQVAGTNRIRVVGERLGEALDPVLAAHQPALPCSSLSLTRGLIRSGSTRSSSSAGRPSASARSNAAGNSAVRSTLSP